MTVSTDDIRAIFPVCSGISATCLTAEVLRAEALVDVLVDECDLMENDFYDEMLDCLIGQNGCIVKDECLNGNARALFDLTLLDEFTSDDCGAPTRNFEAACIEQAPETIGFGNVVTTDNLADLGLDLCNDVVAACMTVEILRAETIVEALEDECFLMENDFYDELLDCMIGFNGCIIKKDCGGGTARALFDITLLEEFETDNCGEPTRDFEAACIEQSPDRLGPGFLDILSDPLVTTAMVLFIILTIGLVAQYKIKQRRRAAESAAVMEVQAQIKGDYAKY